MNLFVRFPGWNWLRLSRPTYSLYIPNVVRPVLSDCHSENLGLIWSWETTSTPSASRSLFKRFNPRNSISLLRHARFSTAATAIGAICVWLLRSNSSCMYKRPTAASSCATRSVATQSCLIISWNAIWRRNSCRRRLMRNSSRVIWMMEMSQMAQPLPYCIPIIEYGNPLILYTPNFRFIVDDKWSICSVYFRICGCDSHTSRSLYDRRICCFLLTQLSYPPNKWHRCVAELARFSVR